MRAAFGLVVLGLVAGPGMAHPQADVPPARDVAVVSIGLDDLAPGPGGASLAADWIHALSEGAIRAGLESVAAGRVHWVVGRVGGTWRLHPRIVADCLVSLGPGSRAGAWFLFRQARTGVSYAVSPGRVFVEAEANGFAIEPFQGQVLSAGATVLPHPRLATRVTYGRSIGGNYAAEHLLIRADLRYTRFGAIAGMSVGRAAPAREDLEAIGTATATRREMFAGAVVPLNGMELTVVLSHLWGEDVRRESIVLSSRIPVR